MGKQTTGKFFSHFLCLALGIFVICLGIFCFYCVSMLKSDSAECLGIFDFVPTSSDYSTETRKDLRDETIEYKENKYYLKYSAKESGNKYSFKENVSEQTYNDYNKGNYNRVETRSVWRLSGSNSIRYEYEHATEEDVLKNEGNLRKLFIIIGIMFCSIGLCIIFKGRKC